MLHDVFFLYRKFSIAQHWATVVTYPGDGEQTTAGVTASWIPAHLGECVCAALVLLTSQEDLPGGVFSTTINKSPFFSPVFFPPPHFISCTAHTHPPFTHWRVSMKSGTCRRSGLRLVIFITECAKRWLETPTSVSWLCNMCINVDSVCCTLFQRVAQRNLKDDERKTAPDINISAPVLRWLRVTLHWSAAAANTEQQTTNLLGVLETSPDYMHSAS